MIPLGAAGTLGLGSPTVVAKAATAGPGSPTGGPRAATVGSAFDRLATVDLPTLLERAALLTRVDRKYVLDRATVEILVELLPPGAALLDIDGRTRFGYTSTYLDTPALDAFRQSAHKRRRRFKVRTRRYEESGDAYLEVKTRRGAHTVKERIPGRHLTDGTLSTVGRDYVADRLSAAGLDPDLATRLVPTLTTRYRRRTVLHADGQTRITIDETPSWEGHAVGGDPSREAHAVGGGPSRLALPGLFIVETKSGASASSADRLLWSLGHRPTRISKYATGLAALQPSLPHNRWHRTLTRHFTHAADTR